MAGGWWRGEGAPVEWVEEVVEAAMEVDVEIRGGGEGEEAWGCRGKQGRGRGVKGRVEGRRVEVSEQTKRS